jgi:hypothetical protein
MMIWGSLLLAMLVMKAWPETRASRWLHVTLVEQPISAAERFERRHLILLVVGLVMLQAVAMIGSAELATLMAIDISVYVDAMITVWTVAALTRVRGGWTALRARIGLPVRRSPRARRSASMRPARKIPSNDDERHGDFALAA